MPGRKKQKVEDLDEDGLGDLLLPAREDAADEHLERLRAKKEKDKQKRRERAKANPDHPYAKAMLQQEQEHSQQPILLPSPQQQILLPSPQQPPTHQTY